MAKVNGGGGSSVNDDAVSPGTICLAVFGISDVQYTTVEDDYDNRRRQ